MQKMYFCVDINKSWEAKENGEFYITGYAATKDLDRQK